MSKDFAKWYDFFMSPLEKGKLKQIRLELLSRARGNVLEIGSGTGINFPLYSVGVNVTAIDPSPHMLERAKWKLEKSRVPIEVVQASAEELPFDDNTFDSVVATLVFCTIPNPEKAIQEIRRVCKPDGKILFFEHVKMENRILAALQDWLTPAWRRMCDGCCLNRRTVDLLKVQGLPIVELKKYNAGLFVFAEVLNRKERS